MGCLRDAVELAVGELAADGPAYVVAVALARALADELDRQTESGDGVNAALVARFQDCTNGILYAQQEADPIGDLLASILDQEATGKT